MKTSQHFNDVRSRQTSSQVIHSCTSSHIFSPIFYVKMSNLVASQIMTHTDVGSRAGSIEKWVAVADICRCLNNYNGVLEITSALNRSAIYRLKKTWAKVSKQVGKEMIGFRNDISLHLWFRSVLAEPLHQLFTFNVRMRPYSEEC